MKRSFVKLTFASSLEATEVFKRGKAMTRMDVTVNMSLW
jgi:hypothetical protein